MNFLLKNYGLFSRFASNEIICCEELSTVLEIYVGWWIMSKFWDKNKIFSNLMILNKWSSIYVISTEMMFKGILSYHIWRNFTGVDASV